MLGKWFSDAVNDFLFSEGAKKYALLYLVGREMSASVVQIYFRYQRFMEMFSSGMTFSKLNLHLEDSRECLMTVMENETLSRLTRNKTFLHLRRKKVLSPVCSHIIHWSDRSGSALSTEANILLQILWMVWLYNVCSV